MAKMNNDNLAINVALELLEDLKSGMAAKLEDYSKDDEGFRQRLYERWKPGLDLIRMFHSISAELGAAYNHRNRPQAAREKRYSFEAIISLHARGVRISEEIITLMMEGFPDGALSRWRSLHENAVIANFLRQNDEETSRRFLAYRGISNYKSIIYHNNFIPRSGMEAFSENDIAEAKRCRDALVKEFGEEFEKENGWAFPAINAKKIRFEDIEAVVNLDHWRPRFRWASDDVHANFKPYHTYLGAAEVKSPILLAGRSNSALTDPAHMMAITLNLINFALPADYFSEEELLILTSLSLLQDEIGETFLQIQMTDS